MSPVAMGAVEETYVGLLMTVFSGGCVAACVRARERSASWASSLLAAVVVGPGEGYTTLVQFPDAQREVSGS